MEPEITQFEHSCRMRMAYHSLQRAQCFTRLGLVRGPGFLVRHRVLLRASGAVPGVLFPGSVCRPQRVRGRGAAPPQVPQAAGARVVPARNEERVGRALPPTRSAPCLPLRPHAQREGKVLHTKEAGLSSPKNVSPNPHKKKFQERERKKSFFCMYIYIFWKRMSFFLDLLRAQQWWEPQSWGWQ